MNLLNEIKKIKKIDISGIDEDFENIDEDVAIAFESKNIIERAVKKSLQGIDWITQELGILSKNLESLKENELNLLKAVIYIYDYVDGIIMALVKSGKIDEKNIYLMDKASEILNKFENELKKAGVIIEKSEYKKFDTYLHEIIATERSDEWEEGTILHVIKKGFIYNGKILRKAKVITSSKGDDIKWP
ncbi:MAG: nucleotide exchange factor GrpE [Caloramator sp.]|nr:nucleotide exchange factor GrpE [Caloramator sp.]